MFFLEILFAGLTIDLNGNISIVDIPTLQKSMPTTQSMINLGYYIKAHEFKKLRKHVEFLFE